MTRKDKNSSYFYKFNFSFLCYRNTILIWTRPSKHLSSGNSKAVFLFGKIRAKNLPKGQPPLHNQCSMQSRATFYCFHDQKLRNIGGTTFLRLKVEMVSPLAEQNNNNNHDSVQITQEFICAPIKVMMESKRFSNGQCRNTPNRKTSPVIGQGKITNKVDNDQTNFQHDHQVKSNKVETTKNIRRHRLRRGIKLSNSCCSVSEMLSKINYPNRATNSESSLTKEDVIHLLANSSKEILSFKKKNNLRSVRKSSQNDTNETGSRFSNEEKPVVNSGKHHVGDSHGIRDVFLMVMRIW